jgi:hypothetical protein
VSGRTTRRSRRAAASVNVVPPVEASAGQDGRVQLHGPEDAEDKKKETARAKAAGETPAKAGAAGAGVAADRPKAGKIGKVREHHATGATWKVVDSGHGGRRGRRGR